MKKLLLPLAVLALLIPFFNGYSQNTTVGGYGELHYNEPEGTTAGELDFHRFVIYFGHSFNDWISFHSEVELEHVFFESGEGPGELGLEQAYLEFQPWERYGFRAGIALIPAGILNEMHEPPTFHGVERPNYHKIIIPTTWREAGAGFFGHPIDMIDFQVYVTSSLDARKFSLEEGIRGGRSKAARPKTSDIAFSGKVDLRPVQGLILGVSGYSGTSTGGVDSAGTGNVMLLAGDVRYNIGNLELRAEGAVITIGDTKKFREVSTFGNTAPEQITGYYGEAAYNFLPHIVHETEQRLYAFARAEFLNTEASVIDHETTGMYDRSNLTFGFTYKPDYNVAVKIDWQIFDNAAEGTEANGQFNAGVGYAF